MESAVAVRKNGSASQRVRECLAIDLQQRKDAEEQAGQYDGDPVVQWSSLQAG